MLLENVGKTFDGKKMVLNDFSLQIDDGDFVVLIGPSGCGKTTILNIIAGLECPTTGNVYIDDALSNSVEPKDRDVAMVFQNHALYPHLSVYKNLTVTGIGFTKTMSFSPNLSLIPFIDMITGPIDTILNVILFVPMGLFLPLLYKKCNNIKAVALTGFMFSLSVEIVQMFGWGSSDINDLITNIIGVCLGYLISKLLYKILPNKLKNQLQAQSINDIMEVLFFAGCTFIIMVTAQRWLVHSVLNIP